MAKVVVVGLDGCNPDLVYEWLHELPNIKSLMENGMHGHLQSTVPPITPQAWTATLSGKNPGQFGFWDFRYRTDFVYGEPELVNSTKIRVETLYHILPRAGKRVALINVPVTYPPVPIPDGFCISSFLTPSAEKQFTHPPELREELEKLIGEYILDASDKKRGLNFRQLPKQEARQRVYDMDKQRFDILKHFIRTKNCDFIFTVIMGTDRMPHIFYRYFDKDHIRYTEDPDFATALKDHYKFCDEQIGEVLSILDDDTVFVLMSDHGVKRLDGRINLNEWLVQKGYMKLREPPEKPTPLRDLDVEWSQTLAWATGYTGQLYLNLKGREPEGVVDPADYDSTLNNLIEEIKAIPRHDGKPMNTRIFKRKDVYKGPCAQYAPDIFIFFDDLYYNIEECVGFGGDIYSYDTFLGEDDGGHSFYGIFASAGPGIPKLGKIADPTLLDIAPTVLHLLGVPIPSDMEGRVLVAEEDVYSEEDEEEVKRRLRDLGYL